MCVMRLGFRGQSSSITLRLLSLQPADRSWSELTSGKQLWLEKNSELSPPPITTQDLKNMNQCNTEFLSLRIQCAQFVSLSSYWMRKVGSFPTSGGRQQSALNREGTTPRYALRTLSQGDSYYFIVPQLAGEVKAGSMPQIRDLDVSKETKPS